MKRFLVFVFAVVLLGSCKREAYALAEFLNNNNAHYVRISHYQNQSCSMGVKNDGTMFYIPPIIEGDFCSTVPRSIGQGDTFSVFVEIDCNGDSTGLSLPGDFELAIKFFIDGKLYETRNIYGSDLPYGYFADYVRLYDVP